MTNVSIKDVAERARVSVGTVSNVLNRPQLVKSETRLRVQAAIAELGFVRNESARHLRAGQSRTLAYVVLDATNPFFMDVARGADEAAREHSLALFICNSDSDAAREAEYLDLLVEERVRGILITAIDYTSDRLHMLPALGVPVVLVDRAAKNENSWCSVGVDDRAGGRLAITHLLDSGHRRIAFAGGPLTIPQVADRLHGAKQAIRSARLPAEALAIIETTALNVAQGRNVGERLLGMPQRHRPTAVFCANDLLALGVLQHLTQQGLAVPEDVAIVGYDDIEFAAAATVPLTSVRQPRHRLGQTAIELILRDSSGPHVHQQIQFVPELVVRNSSRLRRTARVPRTRAVTASH